MIEESIKDWKKSCDAQVASQLLLNHLKRTNRIDKKNSKKIQKKINLVGYRNLLSSPHLEGKEILRRQAMVLCLKDYCPSIVLTE